MAHRKLAVIYGNRGENELRREYATRAFEHRDRLTDLEGHLASAYYYSAFGDRQRAIQEYEAVLRIDPEEGSALNNLAVMYRMDGRLEEARGASPASGFRCRRVEQCQRESGRGPTRAGPGRGGRRGARAVRSPVSRAVLDVQGASASGDQRRRVRGRACRCRGDPAGSRCIGRAKEGGAPLHGHGGPSPGASPRGRLASARGCRAGRLRRIRERRRVLHPRSGARLRGAGCG